MGQQQPPSNMRERWTVVSLVITVLIGSIIFRLLIWGRLEHTSMVFIGLPAILAIITVLTSPPETATGAIVRVMTLALLISGMLLGEAFVCILFAAPLFFIIGIVVGRVLDRRRWQSDHLTLRSFVLLVVVLTPASLEGVLPGFEFERAERVTGARIINASPAAIEATLARQPQFTRRLPLFLQLGFPRPGATKGSGLQPGATRQIEFLHGHHPGSLMLTVQQHHDGFVEFAAQSDDSYIVHWLSWRTAEVRWREASPGRTEVTWTLSYRRRLDPAWYFKPLERYGVAQAAGYLIDTLVTPPEVQP